MSRSFYRAVVRPVLLRLDPETAHNLVIKAMILLSWAIGGVERLWSLVRGRSINAMDG